MRIHEAIRDVKTYPMTGKFAVERMTCFICGGAIEISEYYTDCDGFGCHAEMRKMQACLEVKYGQKSPAFGQGGKI